MKAKPEKIIKMVDEGMNEAEIREKLGIRRRTSVKKLYYDALVNTGRIKDVIPEKKAKRGRAKRKELTIGKRGTIILSKPLLDGFGFKGGDQFSISRNRDNIVLRKT